MAEASPRDSAALAPRPAPRMTMAVLINSSGRVASVRIAASLGKKLPITNPASKATIKPASPVSLSDQVILNFFRTSGVAAM